MNRYNNIINSIPKDISDLIFNDFNEHFLSSKISSINNLNSILNEIETKEVNKKRVDFKDINIASLKIDLDNTNIIFRNFFEENIDQSIKLTNTAQNEFLDMLKLKACFNKLKKDCNYNLQKEFIEKMKKNYNKKYLFRSILNHKKQYIIRAILGENTKIYDNKFAIVKLLTQLELISIELNSTWTIQSFEYNFDNLVLIIENDYIEKIQMEDGTIADLKCGLILTNNEIGQGGLNLEFKYTIQINNEQISGISNKIFNLIHTARNKTVIDAFSKKNIQKLYFSEIEKIKIFIQKINKIDNIYTPIIISDLIEILLRDNLLNNEESLKIELKNHKNKLYKQNNFDLFTDIIELLKISITLPINQKIAFDYAVDKTFNRVLELKAE